jgi:methylated-DNA-[protein]-cysteine S-methyltransferase
MLPISIKVVCEKGNIRFVDLDLAQSGKLELELIDANATVTNQVQKWIEAYFAGKPLPKLSYCMDSLPPYTKAVLNALSGIPFGSTVSYSDLAAKAGNPKAVRAAGSACGRNPFPLFIPCHRVITSSGKLGGFSGGLDLKRLLLEFEGCSISTKR